MSQTRDKVAIVADQHEFYRLIGMLRKAHACLSAKCSVCTDKLHVESCVFSVPLLAKSFVVPILPCDRAQNILTAHARQANVYLTSVVKVQMHALLLITKLLMIKAPGDWLTQTTKEQ